MPARFDPSRAPQLVRAARDDRGISQAELASSAGMSQPHIAAIESGRRGVGPEVLERILRAADYRPSVALESQAEAVVRVGARHGVHNIRVFGSTTNGADHFTSDIDLLAEVEAGRGYFDIGAFISEVERLTGFPVDLIVDGPGAPKFLRTGELVAL
jgi:predicted nucleotidyltransferase